MLWYYLGVCGNLNRYVGQPRATVFLLKNLNALFANSQNKRIFASQNLTQIITN